MTDHAPSPPEGSAPGEGQSLVERLEVASAVCLMRAAPPGLPLEQSEREIHRADARLFREAAETLAERDRLAARVERLEGALRSLIEDCGGKHTSHWDKMGTSGANCPACIQDYEAKMRAAEALEGK